MLLISYMESGAAICSPCTTAPPSICPWVPCVPFCHHQLSESQHSGFLFIRHSLTGCRTSGAWLGNFDCFSGGDVPGNLGCSWSTPFLLGHPSGSWSLLCFHLFLLFLFSFPSLFNSLSSRYNAPLPFFPPSPLPVSGGSRLCSRHSATCPCHS